MASSNRRPRPWPAQAMEQGRNSHSPFERSVVARVRKIRVLLADSEEEFSATLADRLRLQGFAVHCARSAAEAVTELEGGRFDVALVGSDFVDMKGTDLLMHCKSLSPTRAAILLAAHGAVDAAIAGMERGADDFLMKPIDLTVLADKIRDVHHRGSSQNSQRQQR